MADLALNLSFYEDRPVIDQTALAGWYSFTLKWTYDIAKENECDIAPSLFAPTKEQIGLQMDAIKGPAEVLVVDQIERPSENKDTKNLSISTGDIRPMHVSSSLKARNAHRRFGAQNKIRTHLLLSTYRHPYRKRPLSVRKKRRQPCPDQDNRLGFWSRL